MPALQRTGLGYGENQAVNEQQSAAPISPGQGGGSSGVGAGRPSVIDRENGIWGATRRPNEPLTAGVDAGHGVGRAPQIIEDDPYMLVRALYQIAPSPQLERLMARRSRG